jgi:hypothetical protein
MTNDYPKLLKIKVTQKDIDLGIPCADSACPIARNVNRQYPKSTVSVDGCSIIIYSKDSSAFYKTTIKANNFIDAFDNGKKVKPATFQAKLVEVHWYK